MNNSPTYNGPNACQNLDTLNNHSNILEKTCKAPHIPTNKHYNARGGYTPQKNSIPWNQHLNTIYVISNTQIVTIVHSPLSKPNKSPKPPNFIALQTTPDEWIHDHALIVKAVNI